MGIEWKTTVSLNNLYYTFIFDWLILILVPYNNSRLFSELNDITILIYVLFFCFIEHK